jgi:DNA-binding CsgD family transcriptional regulator
VSIGVVASGSFGRPAGWWIPASVRHAVALVVVAGVVAILELRILDLDHGTHLLVVLTLVIGIALLFGSGPGTTALVAGAVVCTAASVITVERVFDTHHAYVQVLTFLVAGTAFILRVTTVARSRRRPPDATTATPTATTATPAATSVLLGPESLTARECQVLRLAATGVSVEEMARQLFVSQNTIKTHLTHIYAKLGVRGRTAAIRMAIHCGCLTPHDICPHRCMDGATESPVPVTTPRSSTPTM